MYDPILLPVDGSPASERAETFAFDLAERYGETVHLLHVVDTRVLSEPALSSIELRTDDAEDTALDMLDGIATRATDRGIDVSTRCCQGTPHEEVVAHADELDADGIVMEDRGQRHQETMGSVVGRVLEDTDRPVPAA